MDEQKLKIGFDLQPLQTEMSKNRGIGRFTKNVIEKIIQSNTNNDLKLFTNNNYHEKISLKTSPKSEIIDIIYDEPKHFNENTVNYLIQFLKYYNSNLDIIQIF